MQHEMIFRKSGYTLLEILVVFALLGFIASIAMPRLTAIYHSIQWANERDDVLRRIGELGCYAFSKGQDFELKQYPLDDLKDLPLELPAGWSLEADPPIRYKSNGVCFGGKLRLRYGERAVDVYLRPPRCRPEIIGH
jgi:prepilin-type N-terminal cleavage/methylation domain-containing protein